MTVSPLAGKPVTPEILVNASRLITAYYTEVPVGFKWFVDGAPGSGGEERAGASFLRRDGTVWTTDKDGIVPSLLSAEMTARMGRDPGEIYRELAGGTEEIYKIYAESFRGTDHLRRIVAVAQTIVSDALAAGHR